MKDRTLKRATVAADAAGLAAAWLAAYGIRYAIGNSPYFVPLNRFQPYLEGLPWIVLLSLTANASFGLYRHAKERRPFEETTNLIRASLMSLLIVMALSFLIKAPLDKEYGRAVVLMYGPLSFVFLVLSRVAVRRLRKKLIERGALEERVLIVGGGQIGIRAMQKIEDHPEIGYRVVGFLDDADVSDNLPDRAPRLGALADLRRIASDQQIDEVIVAIPSLPHEEVMSLIMVIDDMPSVRVRIVSDLFGVLAHETDIDLIEDIPIFELRGPSDGVWYGVAKRVFDLSIALAGMVPTLLVAMPISIAIKLDTRGPVLFTQDRVGQGGKKFKMYKFRTMRIDADPYAVAPSDKEDSRITKVGKFLRKTSLDELPQFLNVLIGNMSVVGPRPEMPFIVDQYEPWQRKRLEVKPGITGLWQILGRKDLPLHENLEYDFYYIKNRSIMMDFTILLRTIPAALFGKGAY